MKCILKWIKTYFNETECFKTNIMLNSNATTIEVIYTETIKNVSIPVPPVAEQIRIMNYLDTKIQSIDTQISKSRKRIELLKELKQTLITDVVTGKIKVTEN